MSRQNLLTAKMIDDLAGAIGDGLTDRHAAALVGISPSTLKVWRGSARTAVPQSLLARLEKRLAQADAQFIQHHLRMIATEKAGTWQRHAWLVERRHQSEYALTQRLEVGEPGSFSRMSSDQLRAKIVELLPAITKKSGP